MIKRTSMSWPYAANAQHNIAAKAMYRRIALNCFKLNGNSNGLKVGSIDVQRAQDVLNGC
jgi:hypothetical protein